jgi:hypothetical protein
MKKDEPLELNRSWDPDNSKSYITGCDWKFSSILANCKLAASFGIIYIDFIFFFYFLFRFIGVFGKKIFFFFFSFSFLAV